VIFTRSVLKRNGLLHYDEKDDVEMKMLKPVTVRKRVQSAVELEEQEFIQELPIKEIVRRERRRERLHTALFVSLFVVSNVCYRISLIGGDSLQWLLEHMAVIAGTCILSPLAVVIAWSLASLGSIKGAWKLAAFPLWLVPLTIMFLVYRGTTFDNHGVFNSLAYIVLFIPLFILSRILIFIYRRRNKKRDVGFVFLALVLIPTITAAVRLTYIRSDWVKGMKGEKLVNNENTWCHIYPPALNWVGLFPYRWFPLYTGPTTCPSTKTFATLEKGLLTIDCPSASTYDLLPDVEDWSYDLKGHSDFGKNPFQKTLLKSVITRSYSSPILIDQMTVIARCDGNEQILTQVKRKNETVTRSNKERRGQPINIAFIILDAVSRAHFLRRMPETAALLENMTSSGDSLAESFQFFRYHSLESFTIPNEQAMFLGSNEYMDNQGKEAMGKYKTIWEEANDRGYVTAKAEEHCADWSSWNQFNRTSHLDHQWLSPACLDEVQPVSEPWGPINGPFSMRRRCLSGTYLHNHLFDFFDKVNHAYPDLPKFTSGTFLEGHELTTDVITTVDHDLKRFLERTDFNNTVLFLLADHGNHMNIFFSTKTYAGLLEASLPLGNVIVPKWMLKQQPQMREALKNNEQALMTGLDIHRSLQHLMVWPEAPPQSQLSTTRSIFETIPLSRTCSEAGVPDYYCFCNKTKRSKDTVQ